jgi:hypothetical protein
MVTRARPSTPLARAGRGASPRCVPNSALVAVRPGRCSPDRRRTPAVPPRAAPARRCFAGATAVRPLRAGALRVGRRLEVED